METRSSPPFSWPPEKLRPSRRRLTGGLIRLFVGLLAIASAFPAAAGPPYVTDDPEPTDTGHWEIYAFGSAARTPGETAGEGGLDINYGAAKDLQLSLVAPIDYDSNPHFGAGVGDIEIGAKYRFLHQSEGSWLPDVSVFPAIDLPTAAHRFSDGPASFFLPVWAEKDFGPWSTFGGGGYDVHPGAGNRNFWLVGWAVTRQITDKLQLGGELYRQTADTVNAKAFTAVGLGFTYQMTEHVALIGSGGPSLQTSRGGQTSAFYAALEFTY
jgi:hypothetical protein